MAFFAEPLKEVVSTAIVVVVIEARVRIIFELISICAAVKPIVPYFAQ